MLIVGFILYLLGSAAKSIPKNEKRTGFLQTLYSKFSSIGSGDVPLSPLDTDSGVYNQEDINIVDSTTLYSNGQGKV